jgi:hypothetical protein
MRWRNENIMRNLLLSFVLAIVTMQATVAVTPLWAGDGWYLLIPPRSEYNERADYLSGIKILDNKPLSQWGQEGAYDSASECESERSTLLNVNQNIYSKSSDAYLKALTAGTDKVVLETQRWATEMNNANVLAFMASRCIKSNDPRLRRK